ncbi:hypothetical protein DIPPA_31453 [Diplonema papillatum]|nr:hypothetical protein DIPPA_31453 [Diplonema papillatum]|eukprot:gene21043-32420_t
MSRAAASAMRKAEQKAIVAEKNATAEMHKSLGLTSTLAKQVKDDTVLCVVCGATQMGGVLQKCECLAGRTKPETEEDRIRCLIAAANARYEAKKADAMHDALKAQAEKANARAKKRGQRGVIDLDEEVHGDLGCELVVKVDFPVGKLGMDFEKNCIVKVTPGGVADEAGVKVGWVLQKVENDVVPADKKAIGKAIVAVFKSEKPACCTFRAPVEEGGAYNHCTACDKFQVTEEAFEQSQLDKGPGKQMCCTCEEFAGMF